MPCGQRSFRNRMEAAAYCLLCSAWLGTAITHGKVEATLMPVRRKTCTVHVLFDYLLDRICSILHRRHISHRCVSK